MANEIHIINDAIQGVKALDAQLEGVNIRILSISESLRTIPKDFFEAKTPRQVNEQIKKRSQHTEQLSAALKEQDRLERRLISLIEKEKAATESTNRALITRKAALDKVNQSVKDEQLLRSKDVSLIQKATILRKQEADVIKNLSARKTLGIKLSKDEAKELERATTFYNKYNNILIQANAALKQKTETSKQANVASKKTVVITEQEAAALKEQDRLERALISVVQKKIALTGSTNRALNKERFEIEQLNKAIKEETILNSRLSSEYQKLVVKMNQAGRVVQNLTAKKESGVRLSNKEQQELKQSQREFYKYNRAVLKSDKSINRFQRNVGNYTSALGKASLALKRFLPIFGLTGAVNIARNVYEVTKRLDGVDKALRKVTDTQSAYNRTQKFTIELAEEAGVEVLGLQKSYVKFLASAKTTNLTTAQTEKIFKQVAKASSVLGLSQDDTNGAFRALEQILSKGNVQAEEIRGQLGERLPGAFQILAKSMGLTTQELNKQLELGNVISEEVLPGFAEELDRTYGLNSIKKVETLTAAQNRLSNAWTALIRGVEGGEGFISKKIIKVFDFLAENMKIIINLLLSGTLAFGLYKAAIVAVSVVKKVGTAYTVAYSASIKALNSRLLSTIKSMKLFRVALISTGIGAAIVAVGALVYAFTKLNKSTSEMVKELSDATDETVKNYQESKTLNSELSRMSDRHDELKAKTKLSTDEQRELDTIVKSLAKHVPKAVTEIDKYGTALAINSDKVREFSDSHAEMAQLEAEVNLKGLSKALEKLDSERESVLKKYNSERIYTRGGVIKVTDEMKVAFGKELQAIEKKVEATNKSIVANEDLIASITGIKNARQLAEKAAQKELERQRELEEQAKNEVLVVRELKTEIATLKDKLKDLTKDGYENLNKGQADLVIQTRELISEKEKELVAITGASDNIKKANKDKQEERVIIEGSIASLQNRIKTLRDEQSAMATTSEHYQRLEEDIVRLQKAIDAFKTIGSIDPSIEGVDFIEDILSEDELADLNNHIQNTIGAGLKELSKITGYSLEDLLKEFDAFHEKGFLGYLKFSEKKIEQNKKEIQSEEEKREKQLEILDFTRQAIGSIGELGDALFDRKIQRYDDEIQKNNDYYAVLLDNENLSQARRDAYEAERDRKNAEIEKKKRAEQIKQAKFNKAIAALEVGVNTASAVVEALPNIPLSVAIGILGAVQLAAVLATPIPKYRHGRMGGKEEFAIVGDGGKPEVVKRPDGSQFITPSKPTLTYLGKGDKVYPDAQKYLAEQAYFSSLNSQDRQLNEVFHFDLGESISKQTSTLVKAMKDNRAKLRVHIDNRIGDDLNWLNRQWNVL